MKINENRCSQYDEMNTNEINENQWKTTRTYETIKLMRVPKNINGRHRESVEISWNKVEVEGNQWILMKPNENQR